MNELGSRRDYKTIHKVNFFQRSCSNSGTQDEHKGTRKLFSSTEAKVTQDAQNLPLLSPQKLLPLVLKTKNPPLRKKKKKKVGSQRRFSQNVEWTPEAPCPAAWELSSAALDEAERGSHPDLGTFLNGAAAGWTERVQGPPGAGSGWSGVSGRVQRPLITSRAGWRRWGCDAFMCCRNLFFFFFFLSTWSTSTYTTFIKFNNYLGVQASLTKFFKLYA